MGECYILHACTSRIKRVRRARGVLCASTPPPSVYIDDLISYSWVPSYWSFARMTPQCCIHLDVKETRRRRMRPCSRSQVLIIKCVIISNLTTATAGQRHLPCFPVLRLLRSRYTRSKLLNSVCPLFLSASPWRACLFLESAVCYTLNDQRFSCLLATLPRPCPFRLDFDYRCP